MMRRPLRLLTALLSFVALQGTLLGSASACAQAAAPARVAVPGTAIAMENMTDATVGAVEHHCDTPEQGPREPGPSDQHCATMLVCAFAVDSPVGVTLTVASSTPSARVDGQSLRTPPSLGVAPELPPPKV